MLHVRGIRHMLSQTPGGKLAQLLCIHNHLKRARETHITFPGFAELHCNKTYLRVKLPLKPTINQSSYLVCCSANEIDIIVVKSY